VARDVFDLATALGNEKVSAERVVAAFLQHMEHEGRRITRARAALGLNLYYTRPDSEIAIESLTPAKMRQRLIDSAPDLVRGSWSEGKMAEMKPAGDVVWSDSMQTGYMRVSGLPKNDPSRETYQLWIVAENQDPKTPVDGGTFDINSDGEVIIPIDAKVKALNPKAFAIKIEKPGGVPVSTQGKLAAVANSET
jgi:hypothetical protein